MCKGCRESEDDAPAAPDLEDEYAEPDAEPEPEGEPGPDEGEPEPIGYSFVDAFAVAASARRGARGR